MGNLIVDGSALAAVLDWELVHIGDIHEDLAWFCIRAWRFGAPASLAAGGLGSIPDFITAYEQAVSRLPARRQEPAAGVLVRHLHREVASALAADLTQRGARIDAVDTAVTPTIIPLLDLLRERGVVREALPPWVSGLLAIAGGGQ
jgi:hypothetical protein